MGEIKNMLDIRLTEALKEFQNGNDAAFKDVYDNSVRYINYSILMSLQDKNLAEDILQETYLEIYKNLKSLKEPEAFKKWAVVIAHNKISRYYRVNKDRVFSSEEEMDAVMGSEEEEKADLLPEDALDNQETQRLILDIINGLPEIQRETVISFYYNQMSITEISEALGVPENTTKTNLSRGRKRIKDGVLELEKKHGTKLYTLPIMVVLSGLFAKEAMAAELPGNGLALIETNSAVSATAGSTTGTVIKGAAVTTAKASGIKWILAAVAGLIVVGVGAGAILTMNSQKKQAEISVEEAIDAVDTEDNLASEEEISRAEAIEEEETMASESEETSEEDSSEASNAIEEEPEEELEPDIDYNEEYYREMMKDITSEPIVAICVDDFDGDGVNGAFVVTFVDDAAIEWMHEDMEGAFTTSSLYYLEKKDYTEIYKDDPQYSAYVDQIKMDSGENIFTVGTLNEYAPSRNYDDTLYIVRDHTPICLGKTEGASFYMDGKLQSGKTMIGENGIFGLITPYSIEDDNIIPGESYEMEDW